MVHSRDQAVGLTGLIVHFDGQGRLGLQSGEQGPWRSAWAAWAARLYTDFLMDRLACGAEG